MNMPAFVNRTKETKQIVSDIGISNNSLNRIIFIAGKTGIGKSSLIKKVIKTDITGFRSILVDISKNVAQTINAGTYFDFLVHTIDTLGKTHFYKDVPSRLKYSVNLSTLFKIIISGLFSREFGQGYYYNKIADSGSIIGKRNYVISVLKKHPYIVHIPNTQFMDVESIELLIDISKKVTHTVFIMEYTLDKSFDESQLCSLMEKCREMRGKLSYNIIDRLPFNEVRRIIDSRISSDFLREIYDRYNGNIYQLIFCNEDMTFEESPIRSSILALSQRERFILHLLYLHNGFWLSEQLCSILINNINSPINTLVDFNEAILSLSESKMIYINENQELHIAHDSIITEIEMDTRDSVRFIAYNVAKTCFIEIMQNNEDAFEVQLLFQNMIIFSDEEIVQYLPTLHSIVKHWKYPETIISRLCKYRETLTSSVNNHYLFEHISIFLTNLCIDYGSYTEAQKNLNLVYDPQNAFHRALQAKILTLSENNEEAEKGFTTLLSSSQSERERLVIELCKLSRDMAFYCEDISQITAKKLYENIEYKEFPEYAFVLRNYAELIDDYDKSLSLYKESFHMLIKENRRDLAAQIFVSKSMFLAYKGKLSRAYKALDDAVGMGNVNEIYRLNNYAVLDILSGKTSTKTASSLNDAILIQGDSYERIITECNLLTVYTILNDKDHANQIYQKIMSENWKKYQYQEFLHIIYMDFYYYSSSFEEEELCAKSKESLLELYDKASPNGMVAGLIKAQILGDRSSNLFYARFPFRVDFLGDWSIEISPDIGRSQ